MDKIIAFCGISCDQCPAFQATQKNDDDERKKIAEMWSKQYNADLKPQDINCKGCISKTEPFFSHCHVCEIRKCGQEMKLENCATVMIMLARSLTNYWRWCPMQKLHLRRLEKNIRINQ